MTETYTPIPEGPDLVSTWLSPGVDYYKFTMSQLQLETYPDAEVTFCLQNRGSQRLADFVDPLRLQQRLDQIRNAGWSTEELDQLQDHEMGHILEPSYLHYLEHHQLPPVDVYLDEARDDLAVKTTGQWPLVTFWETIVMSEVNEAYFEGLVREQGLNIIDLYREGKHRLDEKIAVLRQYPDIRFVDFGTRRHFSLRWQRHVLERLRQELPHNLLGTSNVGLALDLRLPGRGTNAHEQDIVYAGMADALGGNVRDSHQQFLRDWYQRYGYDQAIALTDTWGTDFFFSDFTPEQARAWRGLRQDSGDPITFGEKVIEFYFQNGIDPMTKTIIFSDGLDIASIVALHQHFSDRVQVAFGWGTTLTNDLGVKPLNIVMKPTRVQLPDGREADLVKLSDDTGKHMGPPEKIAHYKQVFGVR